jgi:UDP-N-acetylglucosamine 1-carboxyvinyltransferase
MVAAAITRSEILIHNCIWEHVGAIVSKLEEIGVEVIPEGNQEVRVKPSERHRAVSITTAPYPGFPTDMQAQFSALLSLVDGESTVADSIYPQRFIHVSELMRMGADISVADGMATIRGVKKLSAAPVMASDLRASAALILAGLAAEGETEVLRIYHIDRGYEHTERKLAKLGASIRRVDSAGRVVKRH